MRKVFDYMGEQNMVVLFDEFDSIGKRRDDPNEHGELKRVVNNFMRMLDEYEGDTVIMAATNQHKMLVEAAWRRFDATLYFDLPNHVRRRSAILQRPARRSRGRSRIACAAPAP